MRFDYNAECFKGHTSLEAQNPGALRKGHSGILHRSKILLRGSWSNYGELNYQDDNPNVSNM